MLDAGNCLFPVLQSLKDILVLSIDHLQLVVVQMEYLDKIWLSSIKIVRKITSLASKIDQATKKSRLNSGYELIRSSP